MELSSSKKNISIDAAQMIVELVGNNLGEIKNALDRILLYIGNKERIDTPDVETVLTETGRKNVFEFTNAVGSRDLQRAIKILHRLLDFNESEVMIVSMLARHFRLLFKTRELMGSRGYVDKFTAAKSIGVNPFFMEEYITQAKLFTPKELKFGFGILYRTDKSLKSSKLNKASILNNCVRQLIVGC
jgi:DNA polymerase-3 subunit delta